MERHYDRGKINKFETMGGSGGMIRLFGTIAESGWLEYVRADGGTREEFVPTETLFDEEHLQSIGGTTLTLGHPPEMVNPSNYKKYTVGSTGTQIIKRPDLGCVDIVTVICDEQAINLVRDGKITDLSMGYLCETELIEGNKFRQIKRICNHNALVEAGRAEGAKLHLDGWLNTKHLDHTKDIKKKPSFRVIRVFV